MRIDVAASALGLVAGAVVLFAGILYPDMLLAGWSLGAAELIAVVLVLVSLASFLTPRLVFYAEAGVSAVLAVLLLSQGTGSALNWTAVILNMATTVVALVTARSKRGMAEQGNPMNLPVFG